MNTHRKRGSIILFIVTTLTLLAAVGVGAEIVDRIVAVVNTAVITDFQVQQAQKNFTQEGAPKESLNPEAVLNFLIEQELVLQEAVNMGILVTDEELKNALENIKEQNKLASDEQLKSALAREGKTLTEFQEEIRRQIQLAKIVGQEVRSKVDIADADVDAYYEEHRDEFVHPESAAGVLVRQILLTIPENADAAQIEQIKADAEELVRQLRAGADFAEMARTHSQHSSAASGGELGTFQPGQLAEPFDIAFTLKAGEVSDPIRSDKGFHIIAAQPAGPDGQEDTARIKSQIRNDLFEKKSQQLYTEWIATLKDKAYIDMK